MELTTAGLWCCTAPAYRPSAIISWSTSNLAHSHAHHVPELAVPAISIHKLPTFCPHQYSTVQYSTIGGQPACSQHEISSNSIHSPVFQSWQNMHLHSWFAPQ
jgi:hypothetical protein